MSVEYSPKHSGLPPKLEEHLALETAASGDVSPCGGEHRGVGNTAMRCGSADSNGFVMGGISVYEKCSETAERGLTRFA
jgi:hypothetical protein